ncbi:MAG TPA: excisionase [bacterium]|nr:excisionase [bacterium]
MNQDERIKAVPIWQKSNLTLEEAAAYTGIGINKLRDMSNDESCQYVLWVGTRRMLKRRKLDEYLDNAFSV